MVREVRGLRNSRFRICVVPACRTFDLEKDPEIASWLKGSPGQQYQRIQVKPLAEETVKQIVEECKRSYSTLSQREKQILQSPQHLAIWVKLARAGENKNFESGTQLLKQFWENLYRELDKAAVSAIEADQVIDTFVDYMESTGRTSAPRSLLPGTPKALRALLSHGILQTANSKVSLCHQSYLDFYIANRLLRRIYKGQGTILSWLGSKPEQSLFRREQLRQVLALLSDESPSDFLRSVRKTLENTEVRFHVKHLVLELISQIDKPDEALLEYLGELEMDGYWGDHVIETVYLPLARRKAKGNILPARMERGTFQQLLGSCSIFPIADAMRDAAE